MKYLSQLTAIFLLINITGFGQSGLTGTPTTLSLGGTVTAPTTLDFTTSGTANLIVKKGTANYLAVTNAGNVGVGTDIPAYPLDVKVSSNLTFTNNPLLANFYSMDASAANMGAGLTFGGKYSTSGAVTTFAYIGGLKENATDANFAGKLVFGTRANGSGGADMTRMTITSTGNVGVGTTTPIGKIQVDLSNTDYTNTAGAGSHILMNNPSVTGQTVLSSIINGNIVAKWRTDYLGNCYWAAGTTGVHDFYTGGDYPTGTSRLRISNNGNIGIGTTTPQFKLDVNGLGRVISTQYIDQYSTDITAPSLSYRKARGSVASPTTVLNGDYLGGYMAFGYNGTSYLRAAYFTAVTNGTIGAGAMTTDLVFATNNASTDATEKMRILSNGNVGIGTNTPQAKLDVNGNIYCNSKVFVGTPDANTTGYIANYALAVNGTAIFTKAKVALYGSAWPDFVFDKSYSLLPLAEVEKYLTINNHLPDVPSATEVDKDGLDLGGNQAVLLKKIEELTLYVIEQNKRIEKLEKKLKDKAFNSIK